MSAERLLEYAPHALIVVGLIVAASGSIKLPSIGSLWAKKGLTRPQVVELLDRAYGHFESIQCQDGMDSVREAIRHVYLDHPHQ